MNETKNGNIAILKWILGIATGIFGVITAAGFIWLISSVSQNASDIRVIKSQIYGVESRERDVKNRIESLEKVARAKE